MERFFEFQAGRHTFLINFLNIFKLVKFIYHIVGYRYQNLVGILLFFPFLCLHLLFIFFP